MTRQDPSHPDPAAESGIDQLIAEEVRSVEREKGGRSAKLLILVLLCLIVAGYSSYYFKFNAVWTVDTEVTANTERYPIPERQLTAAPPVEIVVPVEDQESQNPKPEAVVAATVEPEKLAQPVKIEHRVVSGPFVGAAELTRAEALIKRQGWEYEKKSGVGTVEMIRLLDGNYPVEVAHARLKELQQTYKSAFVLPATGGLDVYLASFHSRQRAATMVEELNQAGLPVQQVRSSVKLQRTLLQSEYMTADNAQRLLELLQSEGVQAEMAEKR